MSVYSYHTFVLPFVWEGEGKHQKSMKDFVACFQNNPNWKCTNMKEEPKIYTESVFGNDAEAMLYYNEFQYFHPYVRKAIYGFDHNIVSNFSFRPDAVRNKATYHIYRRYKSGKKDGNQKKDAVKHYVLSINAINLKIYNTGIALFILECENHGTDACGNSQRSFEDIKNINDYGRRISLPFIPIEPSDYHTICADKLSVEIPGIDTFDDNYYEFAKSLWKKESISGEISLTHMCDFVKRILSYKSDLKFTSKWENSGNSENNVYIYPAVDDRMFVNCFVLDEDVANAMRAQENGDYAFLENDDLSKSLYEFAFIDPGKLDYNDKGNCTCRSSKMRRKLLEEHVYDRWADPDPESDFGTVYTVANQGLMALANGDEYGILSNPFLTEYVNMSSLCLVQKATLIHFQREASAISAGIEESGKKINRKTILKLMNLQERFVAYQSQLSFTEVTPQEQGIEMYDLLRKFMFIDREQESLAKRLESLESAADTNLDFGFNKIALIFTIVAIVLSLCGDVLMNIFEDGNILLRSSCYISWVFGLTLGISLAVAIIIGYLYRRKK